LKDLKIGQLTARLVSDLESLLIEESGVRKCGNQWKRGIITLSALDMSEGDEGGWKKHLNMEEIKM
jgi:hypothetical protein